MDKPKPLATKVPVIDLRLQDAAVPWRILTCDDGCFDELVLGDGIHVERMDEKVWWIGINHPDGERYSFFMTFNSEGKLTQLVTAETPDGE